MVKGTTSMGKRGSQKTHIRCRRCGRHSFHVRNKCCAYCGFGGSPRIRRYSWTRRRA